MRSVAETILRQNGYEVMAVPSADQAEEIMELTQPDLVVVAADMKTSGQKLFYEKLQSDPRTEKLPILLFAPLDKSPLDFPEKAVIPRPFEPRDFVKRVNEYVGGGKDAAKGAGDVTVNDDFLDAALGLDDSQTGLQVTDSEVMDKTTKVGVSKRAKSEEKMIGLGEGHDSHEEMSDSKRVESLVIDEDVSQMSHKPPKAEKKQPEVSGKLEILNDQYGLEEPGALSTDTPDEAHDYDWFVNSIAQENAKDKATPSVDIPDSEELTFTDPSAAVDPVTPGPASVGQTSGKSAKSGGSGVEKFIDEFKREIEQMRSAEQDDLSVSAPSGQAPQEKSGLTWEETLEKVGPQEVNQFAVEFARELGRAVAEKIVAKIDPDKLLALIKAELAERHRKKA
jgi:CheY-like chemotaxis protein